MTAVNRLLGGLCIMIMSALFFCILWQMLARLIGLNMGHAMIIDLIQLLFVWMVFIGAAYAWGQKKHLALNLLRQKLSGSKKIGLECVILLCALLFIITIPLLGGSSLILYVLTSKQVSPASGLPMVYIYLSIPVSGVFLLFYTAHQSIELFSKREIS